MERHHANGAGCVGGSQTALRGVPPRLLPRRLGLAPEDSQRSLAERRHPGEGHRRHGAVAVEDHRPVGASWDTHLAIGVGKMPVIELGGVFDDTAATGPDALFAGRVPEGPGTATRTITFTWGGSKTTSVETILLTYRRTADKNGLTRWLARIQPTGAVTEV